MGELILINGIGAATETRLNNADIYTIAELAEASESDAVALYLIEAAQDYIESNPEYLKSASGNDSTTNNSEVTTNNSELQNDTNTNGSISELEGTQTVDSEGTDPRDVKSDSAIIENSENLKVAEIETVTDTVTEKPEPFIFEATFFSGALKGQTIKWNSEHPIMMLSPRGNQIVPEDATVSDRADGNFNFTWANSVSAATQNEHYADFKKFVNSKTERKGLGGIIYGAAQNLYNSTIGSVAGTFEDCKTCG